MIDVGSVLAGRYQLQARVGMGGMAVVYDGQDLLLGRRVAVKLPQPALANDPAFRARFANEARAAAALAHPNVVAVYDVGEEAGTPFLVMEFVEGESLRERLQREGPLPSAEIVRIGAAVADALAAAHERGLIHRDVKPANILLTPDGRVRLADFGIALALGADSATRTGTLFGSIHYLAPELIRGEAATPAADIYALGVVLYEMATGRVPYTGDNPLAIAIQHVETAPTPPSRLAPGLPAGLEAVIVRALDKQPAARFPSAAALAAALRALPEAAGPAAPGRTQPLSAEELARARPAAAGAVAPGPQATQPWGWGARGPSPWTQGVPPASERTQVLPVQPLPAAQAPPWGPRPAPMYPSARWPVVLLGILSALCLLGLVPVGMLAYRQLRLPDTPPRVAPRVNEAPLRPGAAALGGARVSLYPLGDRRPALAPDVYIAPGARLIGAVTLGAGSSVWFNAVLRADDEPITVGARTNLQDGAIVHVDRGYPATLGDEVTVGHGAIVHSATVASRVLIGMGAVLLTGSQIGEGSIIGAGALVPEGRTIPPRSLVLGVPARVVRMVTDAEYAAIVRSADGYAQRAQRYRALG
ncbi:MAG TPA: protein kinase [Chloroflexota bacterium]|nr:protein kinase [Chloroflexota bacterium]